MQRSLIIESTSPRPAVRGAGCVLWGMVVAICLIVSTAAMAAETEDTQEIQFDIPQQRADPALTEFALQADISVIFRQDVVRKYEANPLVGKYSVSRGAEELLRDSGLSANFDERGHLAIFVTPSRETQVKSKPKYFRRLAAAVAATLTASSAVAQPQDYEQPVLEEIVVTAMKRQQVLSDVPISIQAFTGEQLEDRGIADIRDVFTQIPGATEGTGGSPGTRQFFIRSVGSLFGDATVGYYLDQAAFSLPGGGGSTRRWRQPGTWAGWRSCADRKARSMVKARWADRFASSLQRRISNASGCAGKLRPPEPKAGMPMILPRWP